MTLNRRRILGLVVVLVAAQASGACNLGAQLGNGAAPDTSVVPPTATTATETAADDNPCVSSKCHATILSGKTVHDAAEGCTDCHNEVSTPHPVKGQKTFELLNTVPDLCSTCHDEYGKMKTVHSPVEDGECMECHDPHSTAEDNLLKKPQGEVCADCHETVASSKVVHGPVSDGDCTSCHNPHETDTEALLLKTGPALCLECHTEIDDEINNAKVSHGALDTDEGCILCHSPHSSDHDKLMVDPVRKVCLDCHDTDVPAKATVLHGKDNSGNCAACHTAHGGDLEVLLTGEFPSAPYVAWTDTAYPLCFSCHERKMVTERNDDDVTAFRDGDENLHYAHVKIDGKGRSCRFCHEVHGSDNAKLIPDSVPFGKWKFGLQYVKTETGGSCAPACHKVEYYDRDSPGRKPPGARTKVDKGA